MFRWLPTKIKDSRSQLLAAALLCMLMLFVKPDMSGVQPVYNFTFVVDITRSMNAEDYELNGSPISRLQFVRHALQQAALSLPCRSKIGLGVFTDRQATLLFTPIEVCSAQSEIHRVIDALDWRMAWAADSRIGKGLHQTIELLQPYQTHIVFLTDGQEAPPVNPRYRTDFNDVKKNSRGLLVGVGGLTNVPIPKFNNRGENIGFYGIDDVPHRSTFGIPSRLPNGAGNFHARNAPFGGAKVTGDQHLSRLYEAYLKQLSHEIGWPYLRLSDPQSLIAALQQPVFATHQTAATDIRHYFAIAALILLSAIFLLPVNNRC